MSDIGVTILWVIAILMGLRMLDLDRDNMFHAAYTVAITSFSGAFLAIFLSDQIVEKHILILVLISLMAIIKIAMEKSFKTYREIKADYIKRSEIRRDEYRKRREKYEEWLKTQENASEV